MIERDLPEVAGGVKLRGNGHDEQFTAVWCVDSGDGQRAAVRGQRRRGISLAGRRLRPAIYSRATSRDPDSGTGCVPHRCTAIRSASVLGRPGWT